MTEEDKPQEHEEELPPENDPGPPVVELIGESDPDPRRWTLLPVPSARGTRAATRSIDVAAPG